MKLSPSRTPSYNVALPVALCVSLLSPAFAAPAPLFLEAAQALVSGLPNMPVPPSSTTSSSQALPTNAVRINGTLVGNGGYLAAKTPSQIAAGDTAGVSLVKPEARLATLHADSASFPLLFAQFMLYVRWR